MRPEFQTPQSLEQAWIKLRRMLENNLSFGDGTNPDNLAGQWKNYTTNAVADTEDAVSHTLSRVPIGFLVFSASKAGILYKGSTAWTSTSIFLKCSAASTVVRIFIL